ncbi:unnamed protein product [Cylicocyclus nassatus]|uniref:Troponin T n=1 Tax=Cylicocyclus nassatus TaxID=53992 RepID=A0AA36H9T8_CYLNA|nr:unnamed protein product [Cylicocyclus nassatus]
MAAEDKFEGFWSSGPKTAQATLLLLLTSSLKSCSMLVKRLRYAEEEEVEAEAEDSGAGKGQKFKGADGEEVTEAEAAMLAAKKRQDEEQQKLLQEYDENRRLEREKEEEELRKLKEKQEKRKQEREEQEKAEAERRKQQEEQRLKEEEERKAKQEEERRKREEEKLKKQQMAAQMFMVPGGGRNFTIPKKSQKDDKFGNIVQAKQEMGMTKEQQEEARRNFIASVENGIPNSSDVAADDLKAKIKELHQRICKLEADKYDMEKRHERQEYDLKELNERQRQVARNKALKKGLDPADAGSSKYPPKVQVASKYDRQIDRRNFAERRSMYDNKNAYPCFPGVPPPPAIYEKVILKLDGEKEDEMIFLLKYPGIFANNSSHIISHFRKMRNNQLACEELLQMAQIAAFICQHSFVWQIACSLT